MEPIIGMDTRYNDDREDKEVILKPNGNKYTNDNDTFSNKNSTVFDYIIFYDIFIKTM